MRNTLYTSVFVFLSLGLFAQTSLTYKNNALQPGTGSSFREFKYADPGNAGPNQIWDFSAIQYIGKETSGSIKTAEGLKAAGFGSYNVVLSDNGYDYFLSSAPNQLEELGYVSNEKQITLSYSDPVVKMKYPFFYGDQYKDPFTAVAFAGENNRVEVSGEYTVSADAYGTLVLPDMIIKNALRVKTVKKALQISQCGTTETTITRYSWHAQGYRYPVVSITVTENSYRGGAPEITRTAFTNTQQSPDNGLASGTSDPGRQVVNSDVSVILFPNPFEEKLTYNYFLRKQLPVSIELYDMSGKVSLRLAKSQNQLEGLHTGEIDGMLLGLTPGVYYLRFTFDKQVVVNKVVKI